MAEVGRIQGPGGAAEPPGKKSKTPSDTFQELMKVGKVEAIDPEGKTKKKKQQEEEEEAATQATPASQVPAFSLQAPEEKENLFSVQKGSGPSLGKTDTPPPTEESENVQPPPPPPPQLPPEEEGPRIDLGEEEWTVTANTQTPEAPPVVVVTPPSSTEESSFPSTLPINPILQEESTSQNVQAPSSTKKSKKAAPTLLATIRPNLDKNPVKPKIATKRTPPITKVASIEKPQIDTKETPPVTKVAPTEKPQIDTKQLPATKVTSTEKPQIDTKQLPTAKAASTEKTQIAIAETTPEKTPELFQSLTQKQSEPLTGEKEEVVVTEGPQPILPLPVPQVTPGAPSLSTKKAEEGEISLEGAIAPTSSTPITAPLTKEEKQVKKLGEVAKIEEVTSTAALSPDATNLQQPGPEEVKAPPSFAALSMTHPIILELFEKMVGVLTVMTTARMQETTISLTSPQFASSAFYGAQIIIRESPTAPLNFNIEFQGNAQATALFQANASTLMAAFAGGNYAFKINRLETSLLEEARPFFKRKSAAGDKGDKGDES